MREPGVFLRGRIVAVRAGALRIAAEAECTMDESENRTAPHVPQRALSRRSLLRTLCGIAATPWWPAAMHAARADADGGPVEIAGVVTVYRKNSHADVLLTKILEGWRNDGGPGPQLRLKSLYVDQFPEGDLAKDLARKHDVHLAESIREALTLGSGDLAVQGVLSIAEHGDYPENAVGQHLYPRRRFFEQIADVFEDSERVVPVFSDKHLGPVWSDALWMYNRARELSIPFMAGSSLPVTYRIPDESVPWAAKLNEIVGVGYGGIESYGFHALELLQAFAERRAGGETGVAWCECLRGRNLWNAVESGHVSGALLKRALDVTPTRRGRSPRQATSDDAALFRFEYRDGLRASVFMLSGYALGFGVACDFADRQEPLAVHAELREEPHYPHFAWLLKAIERMMRSGRPTYPVERTLLTSGLLDRLMWSRAEGGRRRETPELAIAYRPVDYPHAPRPALQAETET